MHEDAFLQSILDNPSEDTNLLVYADWLEEAGDEVSLQKAEFLRLTTATPPETDPTQWETTRTIPLQRLAATLDTNWLAVVSRLVVENCGRSRVTADTSNVWRRVAKLFRFVCDRNWEGLDATNDRGIRFCGDCKKNVYFCDTIHSAQQHATEGHCIALDLGVIRQKDDLLVVSETASQTWVGQPSADDLRAAQGLPPFDAVSVAREKAKHDELRQMLDLLKRFGAEPMRGVHLQPAFRIDRFLREFAMLLEMGIPRDYLHLLWLSDGLQINGAFYHSAKNLLAEDIGRAYPKLLILGNAGNQAHFIYHLEDHHYYTVQASCFHERLASYPTFAALLRAVMEGQDVLKR